MIIGTVLVAVAMPAAQLLLVHVLFDAVVCAAATNSSDSNKKRFIRHDVVA